MSQSRAVVLAETQTSETIADLVRRMIALARRRSGARRLAPHS